MATNPHDLGSHRWNAGRVLRLVCAGLAILAVAAAIVVVLLPLPDPAAGGTCGPSHGSEPAIAAFFDPVSIGAGPVPSGATAVYAWQAFVGECQSSTNARMVDALALLLLAGLFFLVVMPLVRRAWHEPAAAMSSTAAQGAVPGWYPDPADPSAWRWWDGYAWAREPTPARQDWPATHEWSSGSASEPVTEWPPAYPPPGSEAWPESKAEPGAPEAPPPGPQPEEATARAPASDPPAVDSPAADSPVVDPPTMDQPAAESPPAESPASEAPASDSPAAPSPAADPPVAESRPPTPA